jgi:hypothetical protein
MMLPEIRSETFSPVASGYDIMIIFPVPTPDLLNIIYLNRTGSTIPNTVLVKLADIGT